ADEVDARATARATAEQAEAVRARWTAAAQATKALERLAERHRLAGVRAELAAEERAADDVVTGRHGRTRTGEEDTWRD
ncbi:flagellar export protein FliJ, partial [Klenkia sp. PcliD-1-E]|nr:flagellar export protein FliJ [Klenkia sp. PcliD-1-E]